MLGLRDKYLCNTFSTSSGGANLYKWKHIMQKTDPNHSGGSRGFLRFLETSQVPDPKYTVTLTASVT